MVKAWGLIPRWVNSRRTVKISVSLKDILYDLTDMLPATPQIAMEFGLFHKAFLSVKSASSPYYKETIKTYCTLKMNMNKRNTKRDVIFPPPPRTLPPTLNLLHWIHIFFPQNVTCLLGFENLSELNSSGLHKKVM